MMNPLQPRLKGGLTAERLKKHIPGSSRHRLIFLLSLSVFLFNASPVVHAQTPDLPAGVTLEKYAVADTGGQVWVYFPTGTTAAQSLPCVLIAVAGTSMMHGMELGEGDMAEHLPYVEAGFAVIAYSLRGPWPDVETNEKIASAVGTYIEGEGGYHDAVNALTLAKKWHPFIDSSRMFAVGHSSASVVALNLIRRSDRFLGAIAYATPSDTVEHLGEETLDSFESAIPGFRKFIEENSPLQNADKVRSPVLIFNAADDSTVSADSVSQYVSALKKAGKDITAITVPTGDHYDSMIDEGIPAGINWIKKRLAASVPQPASGANPDPTR